MNGFIHTLTFPKVATQNLGWLTRRGLQKLSPFPKVTTQNLGWLTQNTCKELIVLPKATTQSLGWLTTYHLCSRLT